MYVFHFHENSEKKDLINHLLKVIYSDSASVSIIKQFAP